MTVQMYAAGEQIFSGILMNSVITPHAEIMMKVLDIVLKGLPEYDQDPTSYEVPNRYEPDPEQQASM